MKRVLLALSMVLFVAFAQASAGSYFNENLNAIETEFQELSNLESAVLANPGMDFAMATEENLVSSNFANASELSVVSSLEFDIASFLWGFLCCPIGVFVVALSDNKTSDQKNSFWIGVAASVVLNAITAPVVYL